jgi:hypothetical protein
VPAPLNLTIEDLVTKSYFLCHHIGRDFDSIAEENTPSPDMAATSYTNREIVASPALTDGALSLDKRISAQDHVINTSDKLAIPVSGSPAKARALTGQMEDIVDDAVQQGTHAEVAAPPGSACTDKDDSEVELKSAMLVTDVCPPETLLYSDSPPEKKKSNPLQHWQRKLGRLRAPKLVKDATCTVSLLVPAAAVDHVCWVFSQHVCWPFSQSVIC